MVKRGLLITEAHVMRVLPPLVQGITYTVNCSPDVIQRLIAQCGETSKDCPTEVHAW